MLINVYLILIMTTLEKFIYKWLFYKILMEVLSQYNQKQDNYKKIFYFYKMKF